MIIIIGYGITIAALLGIFILILSIIVQTVRDYREMERTRAHYRYRTKVYKIAGYVARYENFLKGLPREYRIIEISTPLQDDERANVIVLFPPDHQ